MAHPPYQHQKTRAGGMPAGSVRLRPARWHEHPGAPHPDHVLHCRYRPVQRPAQIDFRPSRCGGPVDPHHRPSCPLHRLLPAFLRGSRLHRPGGQNPPRSQGFRRRNAGRTAVAPPGTPLAYSRPRRLGRRHPRDRAAAAPALQPCLARRASVQSPDRTADLPLQPPPRPARLPDPALRPGCHRHAARAGGTGPDDFVGNHAPVHQASSLRHLAGFTSGLARFPVLRHTGIVGDAVVQGSKGLANSAGIFRGHCPPLRLPTIRGDFQTEEGSDRHLSRCRPGQRHPAGISRRLPDSGGWRRIFGVLADSRGNRYRSLPLAKGNNPGRPAGRHPPRCRPLQRHSLYPQSFLPCLPLDQPALDRRSVLAADQTGEGSQVAGQHPGGRRGIDYRQGEFQVRLQPGSEKRDRINERG